MGEEVARERGHVADFEDRGRERANGHGRKNKKGRNSNPSKSPEGANPCCHTDFSPLSLMSKFPP